MTQRIYTRTGDDGETGLFGGGRVAKSEPRVQAYGAVDELNAVLGWVIAAGVDGSIGERLRRLQPDLLAIGAHLATPRQEGRPEPKLPPLPEDNVALMESWIDAAESELPELRSFILPGGSPGGAALHVARTVCRRAEREVVALLREEGDVAAAIVVYLNRLSDLLFVLARLANHRAGAPETAWQPRGR